MFFRDQIVGKYKILSTIGSGGFGTVYRARSSKGEAVAIKVFKPEAGKYHLLARVQMEDWAKIAAAAR